MTMWREKKITIPKNSNENYLSRIHTHTQAPKSDPAHAFLEYRINLCHTHRMLECISCVHVNGSKSTNTLKQSRAFNNFYMNLSGKKRIHTLSAEEAAATRIITSNNNKILSKRFGNPKLFWWVISNESYLKRWKKTRFQWLMNIWGSFVFQDCSFFYGFRCN